MERPPHEQADGNEDRPQPPAVGDVADQRDPDDDEQRDTPTVAVQGRLGEDLAVLVGQQRPGDEVDEAARGRVVGLYRLTFADPMDMVEKVRGEPVYLMAAMAADKVLRLKPQNLVTGLPVRHMEVVS